ncbi:MAG: MBL fold metallo-hydrolase [Candidatus Hecatellaceae archaeon]
MPVKIYWDSGVIIEYQGETLHLDASKPGGKGLLVSHVHGDHVGGLKAKSGTAAYATEATLKIFEASSGRKPKIPTKPVRYGEKFKAGVFQVQAFNSGHIFGSCGFLVEVGGTSIAYTGDLNFTSSLLSEAAEPIQCDILILEATYGIPQYKFPSRSSLYSRIVKWAVEEAKKGRIPSFHVYPVGKAQEIVKLLNEYTSLKVYVHPKIAKINEAHERFGLKLEAEPLEGKLKPEGCAVVYPKSLLGYTDIDRASPAIATGWALKYRWMGVQGFPLSNHADFPQLLNYVRAVRPKQVYTCYGFTDSLAAAIRAKLGVNAQPLPAAKHTRLELSLS